MVEHLHDRLERAETERSTGGSRSFGCPQIQWISFVPRRHLLLPSNGLRPPIHKLEWPRSGYLPFPDSWCGLWTSILFGPPYAPHSSGPPNARFASGPPNAHCASGPPNALMIEDGTMDLAFPPAEVPSVDFGLQPPASAGAQYFALSPRAQLPVSSGHVVVMGVNHRWRIVNGSLVLEWVEAVQPPPPGHPSFSVAAPSHVTSSMCPKGPPVHPCYGSRLPQGHRLWQQGWVCRLVQPVINLHPLGPQRLRRLRALHPLRVSVFQ